MKEFYAKSTKETVQEHTNKLLKNFEEFKQIYNNLGINYDLLYYACLYHDFCIMI